MGLIGFSPVGVRAADTFTWNTNQDLVSADIKSRELLDVLEQIGGVTGWQILVEPETLHPVSAKFKDLHPGEALHLLIGDANYALLPGTNGAGSRLFVFRTSRQNATQLVHPAKATAKATVSKPIPNELIVRLKPGAKIEDLARALGAKVIGRIDSVNAYRLQFEDASAADGAREQLASNNDVASVENNYQIDRPEAVQLTGADIPAPQLQLKQPPSSGRVIIGLVDTAVQPLGNNLDQFVLKPLSAVGDVQLDPSTPSHGTAMAQTILRTLQTLGNGSSSVQILPVAVYGSDSADSTTTFTVAQGFALAFNNGANPINLSLGSKADSQVLSDLIAQAYDKGVAVYAAKGNDGPNAEPTFPAADKWAVAVTAVDASGQVPNWANQAPIPAIGAMGTVPVTFGNRTFAVQGTSPATAVVSASAAALMESGASGLDARAQLLKNATRTTLPNK